MGHVQWVATPGVTFHADDGEGHPASDPPSEFLKGLPVTTGEILNDKTEKAGVSSLVTPPGRAWGMTGLVIFLYVVNYADKAVLGIIAQPLKSELGLTSSQIGLVGSLFFVTFTVGGFLAGPLNKYMTLRWACSRSASSVRRHAPARGLRVVRVAGLCRMLLGLAEGPSSALMHTATYSWHPPAKRGLPGALLAGSASVAKIALAPVLTFITVEYGWKMALIALSILGAVWVLLWLTGWKEGPYTAAAVKGGGTATASTEPSVPWKKIFLTRTFISCSA